MVNVHFWGRVALLSVVLVVCRCSQEGPLSVQSEKRAEAASAIGRYFDWTGSIGDEVAGTGRRAMWVTASIDNDDVYFVRREKNRLSEYKWHGDGGIMYRLGVFGSARCVGDPAACCTGSGPVVVVKTASGRLALWAKQAGEWQSIGAIGAGIKGPRYGNPSVLYNTRSKRIEIVYREGNRILHWNGRRAGEDNYSWVHALIPCTGKPGTQVRSDIAIAQNPSSGSITIVARRRENDLRIWYTSGSEWPYRWTAGPAFGYESSSPCDAPAMCANADGTLQVLARGKQFDAVELAQWEIYGNNVTQLLALGTDALVNPAIASNGQANVLYMTIADARTGWTRIQRGTR